MKAPKIPVNEEGRLKALQDYAVLDTAPEPELDALTQLASAICGTSIAVISLVDRDRQWFKSKVGLDADETSRDISFCGHAILETDVFVVEDALKDERFADNPLVTGGPHIRFYAGAQLISQNGKPIGTLCVIDSKPKEFTQEKRDALITLARMVMTQLELKRKNKELTEALRTIETQKQTMIHNSKMSALGEMAGGVAHEINNPLAIISGYSTRLKQLFNSPDRDKTEEKIQSSIDGISKSVERITTIVKGLQLFSRDSSQDPLQAWDLRAVVKDTLELCQELFKKSGIEIRYQAPSESVIAKCRPSQISQILLNLLNNARDSIKTTQDPRWIMLSIENGKSGPSISVRDSGPGVPLDLQTRVFNPFFTTKPPGSGTGLGLSISSTIAGANQAELSLAPGEGSSTFVLQFPASKT